MKKKYLKTVEDVLALKNSDTKIYVERGEGYYQFVDGILCKFDNYDSLIYFNTELDFEGTNYIPEEEPVQEATSEDIGKLFKWLDIRGVCCMKQITIYEFLERNKDILCGDYVAMDKTGNWKL